MMHIYFTNHSHETSCIYYLCDAIDYYNPNSYNNVKIKPKAEEQKGSDVRGRE